LLKGFLVVTLLACFLGKDFLVATFVNGLFAIVFVVCFLGKAFLVATLLCLVLAGCILAFALTTFLVIVFFLTTFFAVGILCSLKSFAIIENGDSKFKNKQPIKRLLKHRCLNDTSNSFVFPVQRVLVWFCIAVELCSVCC